MNVYMCPFHTVYSIILHFFIDVILDKQPEVLSMMMKHGLLEGLCEIFSTSEDEDTLV